MLGLILGGSVTFYYLDSKIQASLSKGNQEKSQISLLSKMLEFAQKTNPFHYAKKDSSEKKSKNLSSSGIISIESKNSNDSLALSTKPDTTIKMGSDDILEDDGVVVKKDELLLSKNMEVFELSKVYSTADSSNTYGSRSHPIAGRIYVEFWKSPLNYRGYKFGRNKFVVYGILDFENIKLIKKGDDIYLKQNTSFFKIINSDNFTPFSKVSDDLVLLDLYQF
jgi:hypothetical protein